MASLLASSRRFDLSALMREAVRIARRLRAGGATWRWRMRIGLSEAWKGAKAALAGDAVIPTVGNSPSPTPKMALDRSAVFRLLHRLQNHPQNRDRDIITGTVPLPTWELTERARAEFRLIPREDWPGLLEGLEAPKPAAVIPLRSRQWRPREWSWGR